ncbi:MAG: tyrosinase family protein [Pseudomonadota bacterium]
MTTIAKLNFLRKQAGLPLIRFDLIRLREEDIQDLRDAYAAMYEISDIAMGDRRGYFALARGHGYDQDLCHDDDRTFLTWHRSYVYSFEKALNSALQWKRGDDELELTLPYWDWTQFATATHASNGLPKMVDDATYTNSAGDDVPNPLARAHSLYRSIALGLTGDEVFTRRYTTRLRSNIPLLEDEVERYLTNPNFEAFQADFNFAAHGGIHVLTGGTDASSPLPRSIGDMGSTVSASYDPVFWLHHAMCDKVWADWQALWPAANVPQHVLDTVVYDGRVGRDLIDAETSLRYIYSEDSVEAAIGALGTADSAPVATLSAAASNVTEVRLGTVKAGFVRAELEFHRMRPPTESFELRAYVDNASCDASTGYKDKSYAGRLVFFGHGTCPGAPGHCNPALAVRDDYDQRYKHPLRYEHTRYRLDITRGLRRFIGRKKTVKDLKIYLVTLDDKGEVVAPEALVYDQCSLRTYAKN